MKKQANIFYICVCKHRAVNETSKKSSHRKVRKRVREYWAMDCLHKGAILLFMFVTYYFTFFHPVSALFSLKTTI